MANTKLPARLLDTSAVPALNVTGDLTVDTTTLKVDSSNNRVGIGTASPSASLHLSSANADHLYLERSGHDTFRIALSHSVGLGIYNVTDSRQDVMVDGSGRVGIGTTSPGSPLEIKSSATNNAGGLRIIQDSGSNLVASLFGGVNSGTRYGRLELSETSGDAVNVRLSADSSQTSYINAGNFGIGTTAPGSRKLRIVGSSSAYPLSLDSTDSDYQLEFTKNGTSEWWIAASASSFKIHENGVGDKLTVLAGGDVGIGTNSPSHDVHIKRDASETALAIQSNVGGSGSAIGGRLRLQLGAQSNSGSGNADTQAGDTLGQIMFEGQGTDYSYQGGNIKTIVTVGDGDDNRSNQATAMVFETIETGAVSPAERMRITPTGLHTTGGLHEVHSSNPNNFVAGCAADTWHDLTNYNYSNVHNGPGVDNTAQTITQVVWQNNSSSLGYIVRMYVIHGAYSPNTHTIYSSAGTASVLDAGSSFCHIYPSKYDTAGNGGLVYATLHTSSTTLKIGVRFNNHTGTPYNALTMQIKTNAPPASGTTPIMRVWRL